MSRIRPWILASVLIAVAGSLFAAPNVPAVMLRPDPAKAGQFLLRTSYHANCLLAGKTRYLVIYTRDSQGAWEVLGECHTAPGPYPEIILERTPNPKPPIAWVVAWEQSANGTWTQLAAEPGFQREDELGRPYRGWVFVKGAAKETAQIDIYRKQTWETKLKFGEAPTLAPSSWPATVASRPRWALLTIASDRYTTAAFNIPWAAYSAKQAAASLRDYRPAYVKEVTGGSSGLVRSRLLTEIADFNRRAKAAGAQFSMVYYVGHGAALGSGEQWLFLSDFEESFLKQVSGPADYDDTREAAPDYVLSLGNLYDALRANGLPFVLLVDACFDHPGFAEQVEMMRFMREGAAAEEKALGDLGDLGGLFGIEDFFLNIESQLTFRDRVERYGNRRYPYLSQSNPVVLAAAPGNIAVSLKANKNDSEARRLGPLAYSLMTRQTLEGTRRRAAPLPELIESLALDAFNTKSKSSHTEPKGTVTWSNFSDFARFARTVTLGR